MTHDLMRIFDYFAALSSQERELKQEKERNRDRQETEIKHRNSVNKSI